MADQKSTLGLNLQNLKWWQAAILIMCLAFASAEGVQINANVTLQGQVNDLQRQLSIPVNSSLSGLSKDADYMISMVDAYACMQNGTNGALCYYSTNLTKVEQFALGNATTGYVFLKGVLFNQSLTLTNTQIVLQSYGGVLQYFSNNGTLLVPQILNGPNTTGWTQAQQGYEWYDPVNDVKQYWNGSAVVTYPSIGGGSINGTYTLPFTYCLYKTGSTYYAEQTNGGILASGTNSSTVERAADTAIGATGGIIFVKAAVYSVDSGWYVSEHTRLIGEAENTTVLSLTANCDAITIANASSGSFWEVSNFIIRLNTYSGNGVVALRAGQSGSKSQATLTNVWVEGGSAGYSGFWLNDVFFTHGKGLTVRSSNLSIGFKLTNDQTIGFDCGNSEFDECTSNNGQNNSIALLVSGGQGVPNYGNATNLIQFNRFQGITSGTHANTTGVWLLGARYCNFVGADLESFSYGVHFSSPDTNYQNSSWNTFTGSAITYARTTAVLIDIGCYANNFYSGSILDTPAASTYDVIDNNTNTVYRNSFNNVMFGLAGDEVRIITNGGTTFLNCIQFKTENEGSQANCISGSTINHGLSVTPITAYAITNISGEIATITSISSTQLTLGLMWWNGTAVDANHSPCTVYWNAKNINP